MLDLEGFREIPGYPGYYINEDGTRVIGPGGGRWPKNRDLTIRLSYERHGSQYLQVRLPDRYHTIHELVALAWVGPRPPGPRGPAGPHVRHLDNNEFNNHYSNLEWGSPTDNVGDLLRDGRHVSQMHAAKTHCPQGHEYTPENTWIDKKGSRSCKECKRETTRQWRKRNPTHGRDYMRAKRAQEKDSPPSS